MINIIEYINWQYAICKIYMAGLKNFWYSIRHILPWQFIYDCYFIYIFNKQSNYANNHIWYD